MSSEEKTEDPKTSPKKQEKKPKKDKLDPTRFEGDGILFKAKLIGVEEIAEARGDKICQEAMTKLKSAVKSQGGHKQRLNIYVSLDGMKVFDEKTSKLMHHHAVHRISFISRDVGDTRAFGYVCGDGEGHHHFYGIKTEKAAEHLVLTLRDLFQVVFELKRKEVELAKKAKENNNEPENKEEHVYELPPGATREIVDAKDDGESHIYEVPKSNAAVDEKKSDSGIGTLLDLESELATISQGIAQMDAFSDPFATFNSPPGAPKADAWGTPQPHGQTGITLAAHAQAAGAPASNVWASPPQAGIPPMGTPTNDPFVVPRQPGPIQMMATPKSQADPFQTDPFFSSTPAAQQLQGDKYAAFQDLSLNATATTSTLFNESTMQGSNVTNNTMNTAFAMSGNIFDGPSILQPAVVQSEEPEPEVTKPKGLFADLNPIPTTNSAKPPKEMFAEKLAVPKKTLNEIKDEQQPEFDAQRPMAPSPNPFGGGEVNVSVGVSNDPFQVKSDPFSLQLAGGNKPSTDTATNPFSSTPSAQSSSTAGSTNSSNPFEPASVSSQSRTNVPTTGVSVPSSSQSGPVTRSSDDFDLPSPDAPPPPLPAEVQVEFPDVAPAPPPRPRPKSSQPQPTPKTTDVPKISPPIPRPRKSHSKSEVKVDSPDSSAKVSETVKSTVAPTDPFASDPFFTSPISPQKPKSDDDPFAKFDAKFPSDTVLSSDASDPFKTPFDFNVKGAAVRNS